ncbi:hypothetical protein [Yersinia mollaretii]|uniref:hypothetical protein n=1 Tax=Yersinia mollaretii TaxID=33060 RepID=UPI0011A589E1|nr:hypothetical protein [Yersinia mollaretii]
MAKTKWPKLPRYYIPLFNSANVYLCTTREQWDQARAHLNFVSHGTEALRGVTTHYQNVETNENLYLIGVFTGDVSTLAHECAHVAFYTCRDVGVTIDTNGANETYCYLLGGMVSHFLPFITKQE